MRKKKKMVTRLASQLNEAVEITRLKKKKSRKYP